MRPRALPLKGFITGYRDTLEVFVDAMPLEILRSQKLKHHSDQFCWNYHGSGPAQLALALLLDFGAKNNEALSWYQGLKRDIVANLPDADFEIPMSRVSDWLQLRRLFHKEFGDDAV